MSIGLRPTLVLNLVILPQALRVIVPPIKSQGIKTKLVPWIQALVPDVPGRWIEPFLGTGVVVFNSGFKRALLADANPHVIRFYQQVQEGIIRPSSVRTYLEKEGELLRHAGRDGYDHFNSIKDRFNQKHEPSQRPG
jgi:DNA adenine methylase